ncbi:MAG TPA: glycosyltransferase family 4 protein [Solirubrobacteraceae bacterium]|nr:glycosyltransferase family 4 protein [Solirubrobacteraceae bacterium]
MSGWTRASPLDAGWRERAMRAQEQAVPRGQTVVSCQAPPGRGGIGRHVQEILEALERAGAPAQRIGNPDGESGAAQRFDRFKLLRPLNPLLRQSTAARARVSSARFDFRAAKEVRQGEHLIAFNGTALTQFRAARGAGFRSLSLVSANSHIRRVVERHARAFRQYPIERPWATQIVRRNEREYALADRILVSSGYIRESFAERGFADERLAFFPLTPDPRYAPAERANPASTFDVVYVGSLLVHKGVPLLLDAFSRLPQPDLRLVLVGGWKTREMRNFVEAACARDERIHVRPGDPLAYVQGARVCVHAAYEDGFAYAPAEALACGVPLLVSEDTGMKELIESERDGLILPTGDLDALTQALEAAYRGEIFGG